MDHEYGFIDTLLGNMYTNEEKAAIFIPWLGLFGLSFYLTEKVPINKITERA